MAGGRRGPVAAEYDGGKVARRSRTSSSERRARLSPGWMRRSMGHEGMSRSSSSTMVTGDAGGFFEDPASPEGCMRWKAPEDSPEARSAISTESPRRVRSTSARGPRSSSRLEEVGAQRQAGSNSQRPRNRRSTGDQRLYRSGPEVHTSPVSTSMRSERSSCSDVRPTPRVASVHARGSTPVKRPVSVRRNGSCRAEDFSGELARSPKDEQVEASERGALEREIQQLSERLSAAERERNWALAALRESESALQASLTDQSEERQRCSTRARQEKERAEACSSGGDTQLQLRHYRVLNELLTGRCRNLELRLEDEVQAAATREEENRRTVTLLEEQTVRLGLAMVEQQRAFKIRAEELRAEQESFMNSHRQQLEDARKQAHSEVVSLREDYKQREEMWAQDFERLRRSGQDSEEWSCRAMNGQLGNLLLEPNANDMALAPIPEAPDSPDEGDLAAELQRHQLPASSNLCQESRLHQSPSGSRSSARGSPLDPSSPNDCGFPEADAAWLGPATSEHIHLNDSWDAAAVTGTQGENPATAPTQATTTARVADASATSGESHSSAGDGEQQWLLQSLPGFLSASLPRSPPPGVAMSGSNDSGSALRQVADEQAEAFHSIAGAGAPASSRSSSPDAAESKAPASPHFGKWPAHERAASPAVSSNRAGTANNRAAGGSNCRGSSGGVGSGTQRPVASPQEADHANPRGSGASNTAGSGDPDTKGSEDLPSFERGGNDDVEDLLSSLEGLKEPQKAARIWARIGTVQQRRKCFVEARAAYSAAVQLDGSQHGCLANLAQLEAHAGNVALARKLLAQALEIDPNQTAYHAFQQWLQSASPTTQQATQNA